MRRSACAIALVVFAAVPLVPLVTWSLAQELPRFSNPCVQWGMPQSASLRISPGDPCRTYEGTSETKAGALLRIAGVQGGILAAVLLGFLGRSDGPPFCRNARLRSAVFRGCPADFQLCLAYGVVWRPAVRRRPTGRFISQSFPDWPMADRVCCRYRIAFLSADRAGTRNDAAVFAFSVDRPGVRLRHCVVACAQSHLQSGQLANPQCADLARWFFAQLAGRGEDPRGASPRHRPWFGAVVPR
jgi:hypothetical protein